MTTSELLSETVDSARTRENSAFDGLAVESGKNFVLFGAGRLGRKVAAALRRHGIEPLAFADNDPRLDGTKVDGTLVFSPAAAAGRWDDDALFVVTTFLPQGGGIGSRLRELALLGCKKTTNFLPFGWKFEGVLPHFGSDLPSRLLEHARELEKVEELWCDHISRETYRQALAWRLRADFKETISPAPNQYFPRDILRPNPEEVFVDGGAFDGDTLRAAPWQFARTLAIEPDPANAAILRSLSNQGTQVYESLLGRVPGSARFDGRGTMASSRSDAGALELSVMTLDELTAGEIPTFVKLDVEGDELAALEGGVEMLKRVQPIVAVCVYHKPEDLWTIPLFLKEVLPYLRAHARNGFELVAYAELPECCPHPQ